jgi:biopolymer transport protein ExbD
MAKRKKKGEPEMLIVSFCDIVTITTAAMFFAMLITVQEAVKIPVFRPTPRAVPSNKQPVFFECRADQLFYIDKEGLDTQVANLLNTLSPNVRGGDIASFLKIVQGQEVGNEYYKVNPNYLLAAVVALEPRAGVQGETAEHLDKPSGKFQSVLSQLNPKNQYIAFLVRDDSFDVFRKGRLVADKSGYNTGWELLGADEPIKFGSGGAQILSQ